MKNKTIKISTKISTAMVIAASVMTMASITAFAADDTVIADETVAIEEMAATEETPECEMTVPEKEGQGDVIDDEFAVDTIFPDETMPLIDVSAQDEEVAYIPEGISVAEVQDMTVNEVDSEAETESPATTEAQDVESNSKPMLDPDRAAWIYREMNPNWELENSGEAKEKQVEPVGVVEPITGNGMYKVRRREATEEEILNGEYDDVHCNHTKTGQYDIQPGKYYQLCSDKPNPYWEPMSLDGNRRRIKSMNLVKVLNVYEDPKWYGSERTVEYLDVATGKIHKVQPNANMFGFGSCNDFYEVYSIKRIIERRRVC